MRKYTASKVLGVIGALLWCGTLLVRGTSLNNNEIVRLISGVMPNIAAAWAIAFIVETVMISKFKLKITIHKAVIISSVIWILSVVSEIIHDKFLNSPFDIHDIVATSMAVVIYIIFYVISNEEKIDNEYRG